MAYYIAMVADPNTTLKLMILYMLNKLDSPLTNAQLSQFFTVKHYTDYFNFQKTLSELCTSGFADKETIINTSYYTIAPDGYETLSLFKYQIPPAWLTEINNFLEENKYNIKNEVGIRASYYKSTDGDYIANCQVLEGKALLFEVNIAMPSEDEAKHACSSWQGASEEIYSFLMKTLLQ